ncbi:hypothetical protein CCMA1212_006671 [Trichoderma ghanense]|uniref:Uncharacterized protein n=1 Tax=Trichoderma ghanense TaxID=65468 RepID=A0ABY2H0P8_9HYPO
MCVLLAHSEARGTRRTRTSSCVWLSVTHQLPRNPDSSLRLVQAVWQSITKKDPDTDAISMLAVIPDLQMGVCVVVLITVSKQAATRHGLSLPINRVCVCVLSLASMALVSLHVFAFRAVSCFSPDHTAGAICSTRCRVS